MVVICSFMVNLAPVRECLDECQENVGIDCRGCPTHRVLTLTPIGHRYEVGAWPMSHYLRADPVAPSAGWLPAPNRSSQQKARV